jgi:hypothetical protein
MSYFWMRFFHIASVLFFVGIHGASMVVFYLIRGETDRKRIQDLLALSAKTVAPMYVSLFLVSFSGIVAGSRIGAFSRGWGWASLLLLAAITGLMWALAKPMHRRIQEACEIRPSGVPRVADEDLGFVLRTPMTHVVTAIGVLGIAGLAYLMIFKPF